MCYLFHQPNQLSGQKCIILNHILRSEITQIIRRNVQGGTEEVRKFIALSGRLNPKLAIEKMIEAIEYAKNEKLLNRYLKQLYLN